MATAATAAWSRGQGAAHGRRFRNASAVATTACPNRKLGRAGLDEVGARSGHDRGRDLIGVMI